MKSSLSVYEKISPNQYGKRTRAITRITIHHMAGKMSVESACAWFSLPTAKAAPNYCIGYDGRIGISVPEECAAWTSSSQENDQRAITIEVSNSGGGPDWPVSDESYKSLIELIVDICKRYGKTKVLWLENKEKSLLYEPKENEVVLTVHNWFSATACPGPYIMGKMKSIAEACTRRLSGNVIYRVQVGAFSVYDNAKRFLAEVKKTYPDAFIQKEEHQ